ncbi:MAG: T9SS type A sorting domain-containing protein [Ignavibacteria bacterium]|nr:T9SS type A sorting domain-containing protein [Ignavibacteria bacterium]
MVNYAGYNVLSWHSSGTEYLIDTTNNIKIDYGNDFTGSGITVSFRGQLAQYVATAGHEHGHQLFAPSGHSTYSRVSFGFGYDNFSPADMILNGYMFPSNVTFNSVNNLGDYSSRSSGNGNLLKVPIQNNEYFLLASRNKYSKWDRVMFGDTAQIDMYGDESDYGKGLYIYHVPSGLNFPNGDISQQDMECADGLFEWEYAGQSAQQVIHDCFISGPTVWPYYNKKSVLYENDPSTLGNSNGKGDGISLRNYRNNTYDVKWWGVGEQPTNSCDIGTDRLFTNDEDIYTRFDIGGDREDAWKPGFNEVFSPYSSPNTNTWGNQSSGIFIWYNGYSGSGPGGVASLKIYKAGTGEPISLDSALHLTPPSRPMGLVVVPCDSQPTINGYKRIKLRWNHNMEPDMRRSIGGEGLAKRYRIYRSTASDMGSVPPDALAYSENFYDCIDTVDINENSAAEYIDEELVSICNTEACAPPNYCIEYPVRYRVQAVDKYDDVSVLSDFANTRAGSLEAGMGGDNLLTGNDSELPKTYSLSQNYPNPFNPVTNIRFDLPEDNFVTIKVFDVLGREVLFLVNEHKKAGRYLVSLNGANLSSGIYFYTIKAGKFSQTRRMTLLK